MLVDQGKPTFDLQINITNECNLNCSHCYQKEFSSGERVLSIAEWEEVLIQYFQLIQKLDVLPSIIISGGEPFISPIFMELIECIREKYPKIPILVLSNGTLIDNNFAEFIKKNNINIQISLDGPFKKIHDLIRVDGAFESVVKASELLRKFQVPFLFQGVLQKKNSFLIENFFSIAKELHAKAMNFTRLISKNCMTDMLTGTELKQAYESILHYSRLYDIYTDTNGPLWCLLEPGLGHPYSAGFLGLTINPYGKIQLTSRIDSYIGDIKKKNKLADVFFNDKIAKKLRSGEIEGCSKCEYFMKCRGDRNISYVLHGNFFGPDEHCWHWIESVKIKK